MCVSATPTEGELWQGMTFGESQPSPAQPCLLETPELQVLGRGTQTWANVPPGVGLHSFIHCFLPSPLAFQSGLKSLSLG